MENIKIDKFLTIQKVDIPLKKVNIFIGPQAQGKSVIAKLIKYFKDYPMDILRASTEGKTKRDILKEQKNKFSKIFPQQYWADDEFFIEYSNKHYWVRITNRKDSKGSLKITLSENLTKTIAKLRLIVRKDLDENIENSLAESVTRRRKRGIEHELRVCLSLGLFSEPETKLESVFYIPAGRSFFANLQKNVFSFLSSSIEIDYFLTEFGSLYEQTKKLFSQDYMIRMLRGAVPQHVNKLVEELICGKYITEKGEDFIRHAAKKTNLNNSSSGQQEALPMALMLSSWPYLQSMTSKSFIIEEPEAHLFPSAQAKVVSLIASAYNQAESYCSYTITTHSPYILSAFNNLIQAGNALKCIKDKNNADIERLYKLVPESQIIDFDDVTAYMVNAGKVTEILDSELNILDANEIDRISSIFSETFDALIDIEYSATVN
ncbi:AAA family ATPase [Escherichia coli]|uniref:AAA family ATPase n=1 Tax=Escherichia coli TaxID=562 RepID=UPI001EBC7118|nr:ATP-binding protein [Escherichia coli]